jgi:hypothetical protein
MLRPAARYSRNGFSLAEIVRLQGLPMIGHHWGICIGNHWETCDDEDQR